MSRLPARSFARRRGKQHGIVLVFALIALVILLIGAVAVSRSLSSTQFNVGNIGFKRDLANQGERAIEAAMSQVRAGGALEAVLTREQNLKAANYSATSLATNALGVPNALLDDDAFAAVGSADKDIVINDQGIRVRYVVDRLSTAAGPCTAASCVLVNQLVAGDSASNWINSMSSSSTAANSNPGAVPPQPVYRVTVRVTGPRGTRSFFQSTFTTN
jgi:type IV pilus assembly protein PilX